jgi:hypothetical protein
MYIFFCLITYCNINILLPVTWICSHSHTLAPSGLVVPEIHASRWRVKRIGFAVGWKHLTRTDWREDGDGVADGPNRRSAVVAWLERHCDTFECRCLALGPPASSITWPRPYQTQKCAALFSDRGFFYFPRPTGWRSYISTGNFARGHLSILIIFAARHSLIEPLLMDTLKLWILAAGHHTY